MAPRKRINKPVVERAEPAFTLPKRRKFVAKFARMWHPDQNVFLTETPVELTMDSFTESQLAAGLIVEIEAE